METGKRLAYRLHSSHISDCSCFVLSNLFANYTRSVLNGYETTSRCVFVIVFNAKHIITILAYFQYLRVEFRQGKDTKGTSYTKT